MTGRYIKHSSGLEAGPRGTLKVLRLMKRLALRDTSDPTVIRIAKAIRSSCKFRNQEEKEYCEIRSAFNYIVDNVQYVLDPKKKEHVTAPKYLLTNHKWGDCDCMSTSLSAILNCLGYDNQFKVIKADKEYPDEYSHVYNVVFVPSLNSWIPVDTVFQLPFNRYNGFGNEKTGTPDERYFYVWGKNAA